MNLDVDSIRQQIMEKKERIQKEYEKCQNESRKTVLRKKYANIKMRLKMNELDLVRWYHKVLKEQSSRPRSRKERRKSEAKEIYQNKSAALEKLGASEFTVDDLNTAFTTCATQHTTEIKIPPKDQDVITEKPDTPDSADSDDYFMSVDPLYVRLISLNSTEFDFK